MSRLLLFIDIDGVMHRAAPDGGATIANSAYADLVDERPDLFEWAPVLAEALVGHACDIVVHSSWRRYLPEADISDLLEPLSHRVIGCTNPELRREASIVDYLRRAKGGAISYRVLDDQLTHFSTPAIISHMIVCDPLRGVNDPRVLGAIKEFLAEAVQ